MTADTALRVREFVPLAPLTTLGIGGPARWFSTVGTFSEVSAAPAWCHERSVPLFVLGGGSNLVVADHGIHALVIRLGVRGIRFEPLADGSTRMTAGAGEPWDDVVGASVARGLAGLECLSGIPGSTGGTPVQNVGAYGQEVADTIESVTICDGGTGIISQVPASECRFSYRMSRFKSEPRRSVVLDVTFRLRPGAPTIRYPDLRDWTAREGITEPTLDDVRRAVIAIRQTKGMVVDADDPDSRSVGSFFMNPIVSTAGREAIAAIAAQSPPAFAAGADLVKVPAAWLIERAGFCKGYVDGPVGISGKHPLAIVNRGGARAVDVVRLATRMKRGVAERFGISLRPEPIFAGFDQDPDVKYLVDG